MTKCTDRKFFDSDNGHDIFVRYKRDDKNVVVYDIDEVAFVSGRLTDKLQGKIKNKALSLELLWVNPESRGRGLITTMLLCLFETHRHALISDMEMSSDGVKLWKKLCDLVHITTIYQVNVVTNEVTETNKEQMTQCMLVPELKFIIEDARTYDKLEEMGIPTLIGKYRMLTRYNLFEGFD